jgi:hypothetical protein
MGTNILGKHVSLEKIVAAPRVSVSNQNKKIIAANKGDTRSLTIISIDIGPRVSVNRQTVPWPLKIFHLY